MFIRWKKRGNRKYAYLEDRKRIDGRVVTKSIAYLGVKPKGKLADLVNQGKIQEEDYDKLILSLADSDEAAVIKSRDRLDELKKALDMLTEKSIMSEFHDFSSHMAHVDGVRYVLRKIDMIKQQFPDLWPGEGQEK